MITTVYVIRHGSTPANTAGLFHGITDTPLHPLGEKQAVCLANRFREIAVDAVYTSTLERARNTAAPLCREKRITPVALPELMEMDGGEIEGLTGDEIDARYPKLQQQMLEDLANLEIPGGETMRQVYQRIVGTIDRLAAQNQGKTILIITHGCALQTYLAHAQGIPFEKTPRNMLRNTAVSKFLYDEQGHITVEYIGDDSHLDDSLRLIPAPKV